MTLQTKILNLKLNAALAVKHANGWQRLIDLYGEQKATEFYTHLGLNHLERKSVEWEGLQLSREPKDHEKIAVKGIHQAQESSKEAITTILTGLRTELISDGLSAIKRLSPAAYHELTLQASPANRAELRGRLVQVHKEGRLLVAVELGGPTALPKGFRHIDGCNKRFLTDSAYRCQCKQSDNEDEFDALDLLTDLTDSRIANDVQSRIVAAAQRYSLLGLQGKPLLDAVREEISTGSVAYIDRAATGLANRVINLGRGDEMVARADEIDRYEQSALLDTNVCEPCAADDGQTADNPDELPGGPNPSCLGSDLCRCFIVAVAN